MLGMRARPSRRDQLVGKERRGDTGQLRMVVRGRDLDDVGPDEIESVETTDHLEQFATGQTADLRCPRTRRVCRVEDVDVDRHVQRVVTDRVSQLR